MRHADYFTCIVCGGDIPSYDQHGACAQCGRSVHRRCAHPAGVCFRCQPPPVLSVTSPRTEWLEREAFRGLAALIALEHATSAGTLPRDPLRNAFGAYWERESAPRTEIAVEVELVPVPAGMAAAHPDYTVYARTNKNDPSGRWITAGGTDVAKVLAALAHGLSLMITNPCRIVAVHDRRATPAGDAP